jgi:hypothetical protein
MEYLIRQKKVPNFIQTFMVTMVPVINEDWNTITIYPTSPTTYAAYDFGMIQQQQLRQHPSLLGTFILWMLILPISQVGGAFNPTTTTTTTTTTITTSSRMDPPRLLFSSNWDRKLTSICEDGNRPMVHYFEVHLTIQPNVNNSLSSRGTTTTSSSSSSCTLADQMKMGSDINSLLSSHVSTDERQQIDRQIFQVQLFSNGSTLCLGRTTNNSPLVKVVSIRPLNLRQLCVRFLYHHHHHHHPHPHHPQLRNY